ncbi:glycosyltransferase family 4 protein [candidate division WOR-3 bacterium]|nr:glycosyltransferase family 4 protein [candidate division WOR-3 bacterium]
MRILVISNFYPPHHFGGYELRCKDIVSNLQKKGHKTVILTSIYRVHKTQVKNNIYRALSYQLKYFNKTSLKNTIIKELRDIHTLKSLINWWRPDLIYIFNMGCLSKSLLRTISSCKLPVVYDISDSWLIKNWICDNWLIYWQSSSDLAFIRFLKLKFLGLITKKYIKKYSKYILPIDSLTLNLKYVYFTSNFLKTVYFRGGFHVGKAPIIPCGIPMSLIALRGEKRSPLKLLYVGNIQRDKGIHTAIEAISILTKKTPIHSLSIIGGIVDIEYTEELKVKREVENLPVMFIGQFPRDKVLGIYKKHDILIFPSICEESFSLVILEAMASGLAVISTATGGNKEFLKDGKNCLIFRPGDANDLASKIEILIKNPDLRKRLGNNASKFVRKNFDIEKIVDKIEEYLKWVVEDFKNA